ncbi:FTR1 family iron permease [Methylovirgula sp. 4M-Z18]|uniref:FTR1 family iron permease n=1 Tax=Methylovirgula sp. 4M-Z18 TaxID=2293567 RepID=UPI000E2E4AEE|nr:FTR1 family protein [Methylovirgula sp. 4M-Z18]RFB78496.1 iron permease [Methylovirgula sp. 4M-Z18]
MFAETFGASASAALIVFREVMEAGLIVGIVMAATRSIPHVGRWIAGGIAAGILGAVAVASCISALQSAIAGSGQEVFNAGILGIAVLMLGWHNIWMARHGRELAAQMKAAGEAVSSGSKSLFSMAVIVAIAVLREGSEVALFLYGIAVSNDATALTMLPGGAIGLLGGAALAALTYAGLLAIPARHLFAVLSALLALLAAGMAAQAVSFLEQAGFATILSQTLWDTSGILAEGSIGGRVLHTLVGYSDQPSILQAVAYVVTLVAILGLAKLVKAQATPRLAAA